MNHLLAETIRQHTNRDYSVIQYLGSLHISKEDFYLLEKAFYLIYIFFEKKTNEVIPDIRVVDARTYTEISPW